MRPEIELAASLHAADIASLEHDLGRTDWDEPGIQSLLAHSTSIGFVATSGGRLLGHVLTSRVLDECEILTVAVAPANRRRGIAWCLFQHLFQAVGTGSIFLEVRESNEPARALYAKLGFDEIGRRAAYYRDGEDAILMRLFTGDATGGS